jgi:monoamine oxidase
MKAGRSVVVVEARDRVGGRTLNQPLDGGAVIEQGGAFLFSKTLENVIVGLAGEFGIDVYEPGHRGSNVYLRDGERQVYDPSGPLGRVPPEPAALPDLLRVATMLDEIAAQVPSEAPWEAERAAEWDGQTFETWKLANTADRDARFLIDALVETLAGVEPRDLSLLSVAALVAGTRMTFAEIVNAAGSGRFVGGSQRISLELARRLGRRVRLGAPVRRIVQERKQVRVHHDGGSVLGKRAIVAMAPAMTAPIAFEPGLPPLRAQLTQRFPQGTVIKCHAVYDRPFWFDDGLSGESLTDVEPLRITEDVSPPEGGPGILVCFANGATARRWSVRSPAELEAAAIANLVTLFGPAAAEPRLFTQWRWTEELFTRGCFYGVTPPGVLLDYGRTIRDPVGRVHWAGAETATHWAASMEGAVRSGIRAAREALG